MKNLRKLFTLALALMILVSVFTLPAMASTVEHDHKCEAASEIQPRVPALQCDCGGFATYVRMDYNDKGERCYVLKCSSCGTEYYLPR